MEEFSVPPVSAKARGKRKLVSPVPVEAPSERARDESSISTRGRLRNGVESDMGGPNVDDRAASNDVSTVDDQADELIIVDAPPTPPISTRSKGKRRLGASVVGPAERFRDKDTPPPSKKKKRL